MKKIFTLFIVCLSFTKISAQTIRYVKSVASGTADGSSWVNASSDLQAMIDLSIENDEIWVASGTYLPSSLIAIRDASDFSNPASNDRDKTFLIKKNIKLYGGFAGTETALSQRNISNNETILSGNLGDNTSATDNSYHVLSIVTPVGQSLNNSLVVDGFTITGGNANSGLVYNNIYPRYWGGALFIAADDLNLNNTPTINNCKFIDNFSTAGGGAIAVLAFNLGSESIEIQNCSFINNRCNYQGGALFFYYDGVNTGEYKANIYNSYFEGNSVNNFFQGGTNGATGGAICGYKLGELIINRCIFKDNSTTAGFASTGNGSAVGLLLGAKSTIINSLFYDNDRAAVYNKESDLNIINSTLYNTNGTLIEVNSAKSIALNNSIIWTDNPIQNAITNVNTAPLSSTLNNSILNSTHQLAFTTAPVNLINTAPQFLNINTKDFKVEPNSSAVNAGNNSLYNLVAFGNIDLLGNNRVDNQIDIGAYESQGTLPVTLVNFTLKKELNSVLLAWQTVSEIDAKTYIISRSNDGIAFKELVKINAKNFQQNNYVYEDDKPSNGINYYRLEQIDLNGEINLLGIKSISFELLTTEVKVYPNPTTNEVILNFNQGDYQVLRLISKSGQILETIAVSPIQNEMRVSLTKYASGIYYLSLQGKGENFFSKVLKE
ncbi:T9SS type A sorting domain-containing protein [Pedobacter aquae]|uniref:T9SS type A sorting domain-containing protein n=1 Tax=Pedobacter aquae TaxID=2605747 RepID=A0A5C0VLH7_9SPHI|nr:T9SS type A sorting domain-containing protein [Pedobacter aquae]QEK52752.1 T9SS type A sorting domain-containing protein [Pedobacter aquae]